MKPDPVLAWLVLFLWSPQMLVRSLQCYSCNYNSSQASCDQFSPEPSWRESCPASSQSCLITRGHFQSVTLLTRECGGPAGPATISGCRTRQLGGGVSATICSCSGDLCNINTGGAGKACSNINTFALTTIIYFVLSSPLL